MATVGMRTRYIVTYYVVCLALLTPDGIMVTIYTARLDIQPFHVQSIKYVYVFYADIRTNSDYFTIQR